MTTTEFHAQLVKLAKQLMVILDPSQQERSKKLGKQFLRSMRKGEHSGAEVSLALITVLLAQIQQVGEGKYGVEIVKPKREKEKKRGRRK